MKDCKNMWSNYLLVSLFKYCNQGDSDLKNATSEIILTSNKVSLLKWERPAGDGKNQAGEFFFHHLTFFPPDMVQLSKKKKAFSLNKCPPLSNLTSTLQKSYDMGKPFPFSTNKTANNSQPKETLYFFIFLVLLVLSKLGICLFSNHHEIQKINISMILRA